MKKQINGRRLRSVAVKAMALLVRRILEDSVEARCFFIMHQPEEPRELESKLKKIQKSCI